jgi:Ca-activated chloride channel family protein
MIALFLCLTMASGGERDNRAGVEALRKGDLPTALKEFESAAAKDSANPRFRYNRALARTLAGRGEAARDDWDAARKDTALNAKALYNRGTGSLEAARKGQGDAKSAVRDLSQALKLRPGWKEAARNLELARRLEQQQKQDQQKSQDKDKKPDPRSKPDPKDGKNDPKDDPQPQPSPSKEALSPEQADQLLQAAQARDQQRRQQTKPKEEKSNGKDW